MEFTPYYIKLSTAYKNGDDERKYNDDIKANENFINQNFNGFIDELAVLKAKLAELEGRIP